MQSSNLLKSSSYISVSGTLAAGKSSLLAALSQSYAVEIIAEDANDNPFLPRFISEPKEWSIQNFIWFLDRRFADHRRAVESTEKYIVLERSLLEDINVFAPAYRAMGYISEDEFKLLQRVATKMSEWITPPSAYICLEADFDIIVTRVRARGNFNEADLPIQYFEELNKSYCSWHQSLNACKLIIDTAVNTREEVLKQSWAFINRN